MFTIKNCLPENAEKIFINTENWGKNGCEANTVAQISYGNNGFTVIFTVKEKNPLREKTENFQKVNQDSCVEFFVNFTPDTSEYYLNFEINANAVMNVSFRKNRSERTSILEDEIKSFNPTAEIFENYWTVRYTVGFDFIKKYYPDFDIKKCKYISGNLYKCGENTDVVHFFSYFPIKTEKPDFHRPEFFKKIPVENQTFSV